MNFNEDDNEISERNHGEITNSQLAISHHYLFIIILYVKIVLLRMSFAVF